MKRVKIAIKDERIETSVEEIKSILKTKVPKLFDREPGSYSEQRLAELAEEIDNLF